MNNLGHVSPYVTSSESSSSGEEPEWYAREMGQEERINQAATSTYVNQQELQEQYQESLQDRDVLRTENGQLRVQLAAERIQNGELRETIHAYQEDRAAHENVRTEIENTGWWNRCKWVGAIALQVLFVGIGIALLALVLA